MRYLVTGGTGFIGAYATRALLEAGHQVTVFDLMPNREFLTDVLGAPPGDDVRVVSGDVTDMPLILRTMHEAQAERVVHLAATLSISSEANPLRTLKVNCEGLINVFEAALALGVIKVVWASSVAVFGGAERSEERLHPRDPRTPVGPYALRSVHHRSGDWLQPAVLYGRGLSSYHQHGAGQTWPAGRVTLTVLVKIKLKEHNPWLMHCRRSWKPRRPNGWQRVLVLPKDRSGMRSMVVTILSICVATGCTV